MLSRIFEGLPFAEMAPDYLHTYGRAELFAPDKLLVVYLPNDGVLALARTERVPPYYRVIDSQSGAVVSIGEGHGLISVETGGPRVLIFAEAV